MPRECFSKKVLVQFKFLKTEAAVSSEFLVTSYKTIQWHDREGHTALNLLQTELLCVPYKAKEQGKRSPHLFPSLSSITAAPLLLDGFCPKTRYLH
jgi:hypothetical protein